MTALFRCLGNQTNPTADLDLGPVSQNYLAPRCNQTNPTADFGSRPVPQNDFRELIFSNRKKILDLWLKYFCGTGSGSLSFMSIL